MGGTGRPPVLSFGEGQMDSVREQGWLLEVREPGYGWVRVNWYRTADKAKERMLVYQKDAPNAKFRIRPGGRYEYRAQG